VIDSGNIRGIAFISIGVALVVMAIKFIAWWLTGSVALYSDALESIVNVIASFAAWYAIGFALRPADDGHPFGHNKAEYISAVLEGVLIVVAALLIIHQAWPAFAMPTLNDTPAAGLWINAAATAINSFWALLLLKAGRRLKSPALEADGQHIMTDVVTSVGVLAGLVLAIMTGYPILDPILAILVAVNILWQGYKLIFSSVNALLDRALDVEQQDIIRAIIADKSQGAIEFHDLKTRESGPVRFAEFHLIVDRNMSVEASHRICDRIEHALHDAMPGIRVTIHVEPDFKQKPDEGIAL